MPDRGHARPRLAVVVGAGVAVAFAVTGCSARQVVYGSPTAPPETAAPACTASEVSVTAGGSGSVGNIDGLLTFTGRGADCSLTGFPLMTLSTTAGTVLAQNGGGGSPGVAFTVGGGAGVDASFSWATSPLVGAKSCPTVTGITVNPPGLPAVPVSLPASILGADVCTPPELTSLMAASSGK